MDRINTSGGNITGELQEAARVWAIRVWDPAFEDWDGLTEWLEADHARVVAYNAAVDDEDWAAELLATPVPRPIDLHATAHPARVARRRVPRWGVGAIAASVAVVAGAGAWLSLRETGPHDFTTAAGQRRTVALADGSSIVLNGATRIRFDANTPRLIEILTGEALFQVHHDAQHPFVVRSGTTRLVDAGTVFNVIYSGTRLDVAVAQGAVLYGAGARQIRLGAGEALSRASDDAEPLLRKTDPQAVGAWHSGFLQYTAAPLAQIAGDLARNLGQAIRAQGDFGDARFTGTVLLDGTPGQVLARTAPLLGVRFVQDGAGWRMTPVHGSAH